VGIKYLPSPNEYHKYWYIDAETELIPAEGPSGIKRVWLLCASRMDQDEVHSFVGHDAIRGFFNSLQGQEVYYVGHNAISFDGPVLDRVCGGAANLSNTVDTLILSYLYDPGLPGGHSLDAWGQRLKDPKGNFNDFSGYSPEMDKYCQQDVRLGKKVFKALVQRMLRMGVSELACEIEHEIRDVINEQQDNGWYFDIPGAQSLVSFLRSEQFALEGPIRELFPPRLEVAGTYNRRTRKDGGEFASYLRHLEEYPEVQQNGDGTYSTLDYVEFNLGSPKQRISRLLELGYKPVSFTPTGQPKVDEDSLLAYAEESGRPEVKAIADWLVLQGRSTMVEGWLNNVNYDDHCMHGRVMTCAAATPRMIHNSPNTANIPKPKAKVKYGIECRRLWRARPNRVKLDTMPAVLRCGCLLNILTMMKLLAYFTTGDPHLLNTRNLELPDEMRDLTVKNGFYAYLYGAGDPKLGVHLNQSLQGRCRWSLW
jgi:DNA polymerase-1